MQSNTNTNTNMVSTTSQTCKPSWALALATGLALAGHSAASCPSGQVCGRKPQGGHAAFLASPVVAGKTAVGASRIGGATMSLLPPSSSSSNRGDAVLQRMISSSATSPVKRRHLGPTAEDIVSLRRAERENKRQELASLRAAAQEMEVDRAHVDEASIAVEFVSSTAERSNGGGERRGRHLGPTLEEIQTMRNQAHAARKAQSQAARQPQAAPIAAEKEGGEEEIPASVGDGPTEVQVKALEGHGMGRHECPKTKAEAAEMLRVLREVHLGNAMGLNIDAGEVSAELLGGSKAEVEAVVSNYSAGKKDVGHLQFALKGISSIRRDGSITKTNALKE